MLRNKLILLIFICLLINKIKNEENNEKKSFIDKLKVPFKSSENNADEKSFVKPKPENNIWAPIRKGVEASKKGLDIGWNVTKTVALAPVELAKMGYEAATEALGINTTISTGLDSNSSFVKDIKNLTDFEDSIKLIFPGTKWCGGGNIAKNDKERGAFKNLDNCCHDHDLCPDSISAGQTKHGLHNTGWFTRSHCDCDQEFFNCLQAIKTNPSAAAIGNTYFNILSPQCFKEAYPILKCSKWIKSISGQWQCHLYEEDMKAKPIFQWRSSPYFLFGNASDEYYTNQ